MASDINFNGSTFFFLTDLLLHKQPFVPLFWYEQVICCVIFNLTKRALIIGIWFIVKLMKDAFWMCLMEISNEKFSKIPI